MKRLRIDDTINFSCRVLHGSQSQNESKQCRTNPTRGKCGGLLTRPGQPDLVRGKNYKVAEFYHQNRIFLPAFLAHPERKPKQKPLFRFWVPKFTFITRVI